MDDMGGFILFKKPFGLLWIPVEAVRSEKYVFECSKRLARYVPQIGFLRRDEHPCFALTLSESRSYRFGFDDMLYCGPDEARATGDQNDGHDKVKGRESRGGKWCPCKFEYLDDILKAEK